MHILALSGERDKRVALEGFPVRPSTTAGQSAPSRKGPEILARTREAEQIYRVEMSHNLEQESRGMTVRSVGGRAASTGSCTGSLTSNSTFSFICAVVLREVGATCCVSVRFQPPTMVVVVQLRERD